MGNIQLPPELHERVKGLQYQGVILTHGWFIIGPVTNRQTKRFTLSNAVVVKRWGTERGVGPLIDGPADATELDILPGDFEFEEHAVLYRFECNVDAWCSIMWPASVDMTLDALLEDLRAQRAQEKLLGESPHEIPHDLVREFEEDATPRQKTRA